MNYIFFRHYREDLYASSSRDPNKRRPPGFSNALCLFSILEGIVGSGLENAFKLIIWYDGSESDFSSDPLILMAAQYSSRLSVSYYRENFRATGDNKGGQISEPVMWGYISNNLNRNDYVYLVENDYLHSPKAIACLDFVSRASPSGLYVTLYDSPDYYRLPIHKAFSGRHLDFFGLTWREVLNTTGTFFVDVGTFMEDLQVFSKFQDFDAFNRIVGLRGRSLIAPFGGLASHEMEGQSVDFPDRKDVYMLCSKVVSSCELSNGELNISQVRSL